MGFAEIRNIFIPASIFGAIVGVALGFALASNADNTASIINVWDSAFSELLRASKEY